MSRDFDAVLEALHRGTPEQQVRVLRNLIGGEPVEGLATRCVQLAGAHNDEVRMWAAEVLESSVKPAVSDVQPLAQLLANADDGEIAYWASTMLGRLGPEASAAATELEACVRESLYLPARERAAWAISRIGPAAAAATPTLREIASDAPPRLRRLAMEALDSVRGSAA